MTISNPTLKARIIVGVDVSKHHLDVAIFKRRSAWRFDNTQAGIMELLIWLKGRQADFIVAEATGGLELPMLLTLHESGYLVSRVNPRWIKDYASAKVMRAKTDPLDARIIASYAATLQPEPWTPWDKDTQSFKDLAARRRQLIGLRTMERNRIQQTRNAFVVRQQMQMIDTIQEQIKEIEIAMERMIANRKDWARKSEIIQSVPGLAHITAIGLIADLPELGTCNSKQIAALIGVAPFNYDSGAIKGYRRTHGGRATVRNLLYIVAMGLSRGNNLVMKTFYHRLVDSGKPKKVALVAVIRKLIVTLNAMIKNNAEWQMPTDKIPTS